MRCQLGANRFGADDLHLVPESRESHGHHERGPVADLDLDAIVDARFGDREHRSEGGSQDRNDVGIGSHDSGERRGASCRASRGLPATSPRDRIHRVARSGRSVRRTERTRPTRNVRIPASVSPTRYQTEPFATRPSGCTIRSLSAPARSPYSISICTDSLIACCRTSRCAGGGTRRRSQSVGSMTTAADAASAEARNGSGSADQLAERRLHLGRRGCRSGHEEQRPRFRSGEAAQVGTGSAHQ